MSPEHEIEAEGCPACGELPAELFRQVRDLRLMRCGSCGLVHTKPQHAARVLERYRNEYDLAQHFGELAPRKRVLFERRLAELPEPAPGKNRLCDVGCADGQFLELAAQRGWEPYGIELNPPAAERARLRGATVALGRVEDLENLGWGSFDVVTSWDCLEHVPRASEFARRITALTRPGGIVLLTTLNLDSLVHAVFRSRWDMIQEDHFTYWDRHSLSKLFARAGCMIDGITSYGLGRDFVRGLDRIERLRRQTRTQPMSETADLPSPRRWDVNVQVLRAETLVNRVLAASGLGVDLYARMSRPEADPNGG